MKYHRLIAILLLLESRRIVSATEMARAFETSERTVYRDIQSLCEAGVPIQAISGPGGGFSLMESSRIKLEHLESQELVSLFLLGQGIHPEQYADNAIQLKNLLMKLQKTLPQEFLPDVKKATNRFLFDPSPWWTEMAPTPFFQELRKAVWKSLAVRMVYEKKAGEEQERVVQPYGLVVKQGEWYMVGFCEKRNEMRIFKCSKIKHLELSDREFHIPEDFSLESFWNSQLKLFFHQVREREREPYFVEVQVPQKMLGFFEDFQIVDRKSQRDSVVLRVNMYSYSYAVYRLIPVLDRLQLLAPAELLTGIQKRLQTLLQHIDTMGGAARETQ
ncbi:MAG TPA: YafY family protein [Thermotogota bacterium]|nr:YafY family protein [Thermotogota bacterium]